MHNLIVFGVIIEFLSALIFLTFWNILEQMHDFVKLHQPVLYLKVDSLFSWSSWVFNLLVPFLIMSMINGFVSYGFVNFQTPINSYILVIVSIILYYKTSHNHFSRIKRTFQL